MLTVVTPATGTRLTTVANVRADLGLKAGSPSDAQLGRYIDQASAAIVDYCRRPFGLESVQDTYGWGELRDVGPILSRLPMVELIGASFDGSPLLTTEYRFDATTGRFQRMWGDEPGLWSGGTLIVSYRAGYILPSDANGAPAATLPATVQRAAIRLVGAYLSAASRDALIKSDSTEGVGSTSWWVPGANSVLADPEAEQLLAPFRRLF